MITCIIGYILYVSIGLQWIYLYHWIYTHIYTYISGYYIYIYMWIFDCIIKYQYAYFTYINRYIYIYIYLYTYIHIHLLFHCLMRSPVSHSGACVPSAAWLQPQSCSVPRPAPRLRLRAAGGRPFRKRLGFTRENDGNHGYMMGKWWKHDGKWWKMGR